MKCYYHPQQDSVHTCSVCRRFLCASCSHSIKGSVYCQDCLIAGAELAAVAKQPGLANYSPGRAALLALVPGMGAVYNGQYTKAVVHFSIFFGLWLLADLGSGVFGLAAFSFYVFTILDAYRSAQALIQHRIGRLETESEIEKREVNAPLWGVILVAMGLLFFLDNLGWVRVRSMAEFWPLILIGVGVYLIVGYYRRPGELSRSGLSAEPPPSGEGRGNGS